MSLREWLLGLLLAVAAGCVVRGIAVVSTSGAWVAAGVAVAGVAWLFLAETGDGNET